MVDGRMIDRRMIDRRMVDRRMIDRRIKDKKNVSLPCVLAKQKNNTSNPNDAIFNQLP